VSAFVDSFSTRHWKSLFWLTNDITQDHSCEMIRFRLGYIFLLRFFLSLSLSLLMIYWFLSFPAFLIIWREGTRHVVVSFFFLSVALLPGCCRVNYYNYKVLLLLPCRVARDASYIPNYRRTPSIGNASRH
jgi:hypothetical protein